MERQLSDNRLFYLLLYGFLLSYIFCYVRVCYFNGAVTMRAIADVPAYPKIGIDLLDNVARCEQCLKNGLRGDGIVYFSPLWVVAFGGLSKLDPVALRWAWTLSTLACFCTACVIMPGRWREDPRLSPASALIVGLGFMSYGLRFEMERGQWNAITLTMCLTALLLLRSQRREVRCLGYLLYVIAVQVKLWPVVLAITFLRPEQGWLRNVGRLVCLAAANVACLFVLGRAFFATYVDALLHHEATTNIWVGNHSLYSFGRQLAVAHAWNPALGDWLSIALFACFVVTIGVAFWRGCTGGNLMIVVLCILAAALLPRTSHDYKLVIVTMAMALLFGAYRFRFGCRSPLGLLESGLLLLVSIAYNFTTFSYHYKNDMALSFQNCAPAITVMAMAVMILLWLRASYRNEKGGVDEVLS